MHPSSPRSTAARTRRGFTLLEALFGCVILSVTMLALGVAVSAGQRASIDSQKAVLGAMAVDDMLAELATVPYASLAGYHGFSQAVGAIESIDGDPYPAPFWCVGRRVAAVEQEIDVPSLGVKVRGMAVIATAFDEVRDVAVAEVFIPEPAE